MTRDEQNQKLAEWIEPVPTWDKRRLESEVWISDGGAWWRPMADAIHDYELIGPFPVNFFASADLSFLLLQKMPDPDLWLESKNNESELWGCTPGIREDAKAAGVIAFDADLKTAIALAALALIMKSA